MSDSAFGIDHGEISKATYRVVPNSKSTKYGVTVARYDTRMRDAKTGLPEDMVWNQVRANLRNTRKKRIQGSPG